MIEGGVAANVIAKEASARVAIRIAVGDQKTGAGVVWERIRRLLGVDHHGENDEGEGEGLAVEFFGGYGPVECECDVEGEFTQFSLSPDFGWLGRGANDG